MPYAPPPPPGPFTLPITPERFRWCVDVLSWGPSALAQRLEISTTVAAHMIKGDRNIPYRVAVWIETLAQHAVAFPRPFFWGEDATDVGSLRHIKNIEAAWDRPKVPDPVARVPNPVAELLGEYRVTGPLVLVLALLAVFAVYLGWLARRL